MQKKRNAESYSPRPSGQASTYQLERVFVLYDILNLATWAVPSESLQGVRRVPMAKITALLVAASVLVLSIVLLFLIAR